jgi:hypothetical protein
VNAIFLTAVVGRLIRSGMNCVGHFRILIFLMVQNKSCTNKSRNRKLLKWLKFEPKTAAVEWLASLVGNFLIGPAQQRWMWRLPFDSLSPEQIGTSIPSNFDPQGGSQLGCICKKAFAAFFISTQVG